MTSTQRLATAGSSRSAGARPGGEPAGFTLIELLIVIVIIGILAAIAIPRFASTKDRAILASMRSDLRTLISAQAAYFATHNEYADDGELTSQAFRTSAGVVVVIDSATATGWGAHATHPGIPDTCRVAVSGEGASPPTCTST